ncbi:hypothetical protein VSV34_004321 [Salmonella enterica]|nr:hypothetical protein [Salmonella enterica]
MSEPKVTYITDDKSLKDILVMAIEQEGGISPNHILCVAHKYLLDNCGVPEGNIQSVDEVEVDGDAMPREIRIHWTRVKRPSAVTPTAAEVTELEREQCQQILSTILETVRARAKYAKIAGTTSVELAGSIAMQDIQRLTGQMTSDGPLTLKDFEPLRLANITPGELAALREALEDKGRRLDTAEGAVTSLQIQLAEAHRRHAEDNTEHDRETTKLRATIKSMQNDVRYTRKSASVRAAWEELAAIDLTTARMVILSGFRAYPDHAAEYLDTPHYRLNANLVAGLPAPIVTYIHAMCDNLLLSPQPKSVTLQMVKDMANRIQLDMSASTYTDLTHKYTGGQPLYTMSPDKYEAFYVEADDLLKGETF